MTQTGKSHKLYWKNNNDLLFVLCNTPVHNFSLLLQITQYLYLSCPRIISLEIRLLKYSVSQKTIPPEVS